MKRTDASGNHGRAVSLSLCFCLILLLFAPAAHADPYLFESRSISCFSRIIELLREENTRPTDNLRRRIEAELENIRNCGAPEYAIALAIMDCWDNVAMNDEYRLWIWQGGETAGELGDSGIENSASHAFIVMGYELSGGRMRDELKLRCDAAAAAARSYPETFIVCTGGETGPNNRNHRTEADVIRKYLADECGIAADRLLTEDESRNTAGNAVNVFRLLKQNGIRSVTIITSGYHQRWCQLLFRPMAEIYRQLEDYNVDIIANFNVVGEKGLSIQNERKSALSQLSQIFGRYNDSKKLHPSE